MKFLRIVLLLLSFSLLIPQSSKAASECLDANKVEKIWRSFEWFVFDNSHATKLSAPSQVMLCNTKDYVYKTLAGLLFLEDLKDLPRIESPFDQGVLNEAPLDFFKRRVKKVYLDPNNRSPFCGSRNLANASIGSGGITLCNALFAEIFPQFQRAATLLHESKHYDEGAFHVLCDHGPYEGGPWCDTSYESRGAFALEAEFLLRLSKYGKLAEEVRIKARQRAFHILLQNFNIMESHIRSGAALIDAAGKVYFFDGKTVERPLHLQSAPINSVNFFGILEPLANPVVGSMDMSIEIGETCYLDESSILCKSVIGNEEIFKFPNLIPKTSRFVRTLVAPTSSRYKGIEKAAVLSSDSPLNLIPKNLWEAKEFKTLSNPYRFKQAVVLSPEESLGLTEDGQVYSFRYWGERAKPVPELRGLRFQRIEAPIYSAKALDDFEL